MFKIEQRRQRVQGTYRLKWSIIKRNYWPHCSAKVVFEGINRSNHGVQTLVW